MNFSFHFFVLQLCFLLVSTYLVRNCYSVCACFRAGASTFQVLARYDSVRARHDSADAYFFPARARYDTAHARYDTAHARYDTAHARLYSVRARVYYARARLYSVRARVYSVRARLYNARTRLHSVCARLYSARARLYSAHARLHSVHARQSTSRFRLRLPHKRPRPWLSVRARRRTVRALERPVRSDINAFAPEGSRETTAACARGTISPRPFATTQCPKPLHLGLQLRKQLLARYVVGEDKS
jgi:hypothetical protein